MGKKKPGKLPSLVSQSNTLTRKQKKKQTSKLQACTQNKTGSVEKLSSHSWPFWTRFSDNKHL